MKKLKLGFLSTICIAIALGLLLGPFLPTWSVRIFATFNDIFGNFLKFIIPLIIIGFVTPAIAQLGTGAGRLLLVTTLVAYGDTLCAGFISYGVSDALFPSLIDGIGGQSVNFITQKIEPYFTVAIPPIMDVMTSLVTSFIFGLGIAYFKADYLWHVFDETKNIVSKTISVAVLPPLGLFIFGIFLMMSHSGQAMQILKVFGAVIIAISIMLALLLILQYVVMGIIVRKNPIKALINMMPAFMMTFGTCSSAATIPVSIKQCLKNGVSSQIAGFVVPLCANIHLSGSTMKLTAIAVALLLIQGQDFDVTLFSKFICLLGIITVAAPGVPGGATIASLGLLDDILGFSAADQGLVVALSMVMDSIGSAVNSTGDGAIALVMEKFFGKGNTQAA